MRVTALTVTGGTGPYTFSISNGALPAGLNLDATTGVVSGTPTATGTFSFEVRVTDAYGCFASRAYVLTINCPTINVEPANSNLANGAMGTAYNQTFSATGGVGAYAFDVEIGALPNGLALDASTGVLSGAPTASGAFNFVIRATDSNGCVGRRAYRIVVNRGARERRPKLRSLVVFREFRSRVIKPVAVKRSHTGAALFYSAFNNFSRHEDSATCFFSQYQ
jgi:large repetitive protein